MSIFYISQWYLLDSVILLTNFSIISKILFLKFQFQIKFLLKYLIYNQNFEQFFLKVSFFSTSSELSNKQRFEYFLRTVPSDKSQASAMVEIVKKLNWTYVSIIYEESIYGIRVSFKLSSNVCVKISFSLNSISIWEFSVCISLWVHVLFILKQRSAAYFGSRAGLNLKIPQNLVINFIRMFISFREF
jgi:hypothetical protein